MKNNPILILAGEPFSVFTEIFLKSFKKIKNKKKNNFNYIKNIIYKTNESS